MGDSATTSASSTKTGKKKAVGSAGKARKPNAKQTHPRTADMVKSAIRDLKERKGSSLQAIKKYITTTYLVDVQKFAPFLRKYLNSAVNSGDLIRTKGIGASGSFKLAVTGKEKIAKKKETKTSAPAKPKTTKAAPKPKSAVKKAARAKKVNIKKSSPKKSAVKPQATKAPAKQASKTKKAKSPKKAAPKKK